MKKTDKCHIRTSSTFWWFTNGCGAVVSNASTTRAIVEAILEVNLLSKE